MRAKKYLGQYFLKNKNIARKIVEAANLNKNDVVLEVGPGKGVLTKLLLQKAGRVIAVEKDRNLADFLMDNIKDNNLSVICGDILKFTWKRSFQVETPFLYKIVANIPYYITSHFLRKFLQSDFQPTLMVLMLQKEVAERIVAKSAGRRSKESILSISVKAYCKPKIIAKVAAKNFSPSPKVDSAVVAFENISKDFFNPLAGGNKINEKKFFQLVKLGFSHKRKLLKNNLAPLLLDTEYLTKAGIGEKARAEDLTLENWAFLARNLEKKL